MGELYRKAGNQQLLDILDDVLQQLKSIKDDPTNKSDGFDRINDYLDNKINMLRAENHRNEKGWDFSREKQTAVFTKDEEIILRPFHPSDKAYYLHVCEPWMSHFAIDAIQQGVEDSSWSETIKDQAFYCVVEDKVIGPVGYIGIKDTSTHLWEVSIELEGQFCHKGYGTRALSLFLRRMKELTGEEQFRALVEVDNPASQGLMSKLGGELVGIYDLLFKNEERAAKYESENMDLITEHMRHLAAQLDVEPQKLLTHVLDYRLYIQD